MSSSDKDPDVIWDSDEDTKVHHQHHPGAEIHFAEEPDFSRIDNLPEVSPRPSVKVARGKRIISWIKERFVWVVYMTMIIQVGANVGVLAALPGILTSEVLYFRIPLTRHVINSQAVPIFAPCVINHLILGEWYFVRHRFTLQEGDMLGILSIVLLFVTAVSIDACRLIQSHLRLVELRLHDGKNETDYNRQCLRTYIGLAKDLDHVTLTPVRHLIANYQNCGTTKNLKDSIALFPNFTAKLTTEKLNQRGFRCCSSKCVCHPKNGTMYTISLTKLMDEMGRVYSYTYPIYIVFVLASLCSIFAFLHYNSQGLHLQ